MIEILTCFNHNLLSPAILFFVVGIIAGVIKSDLDIPDSIGSYLSIYLMMAIGFKGGVAISTASSLSYEFLAVIVSGIVLGLIQPFLGYFFLKVTTKIDKVTAAAVAAHYGSISVVTFVTATSFLQSEGVFYAGYIIGVLALMEAPAIVSGLFIAHRVEPSANHSTESLGQKIWTNGAIVLLISSFLIGFVTGQRGFNMLEGFLITPFQGMLALFLLDMGLVVSKQLHHLKTFTWKLALFGIYMPLIGACIGLFLSWWIGLNVGTGLLFTVLAASASYIAVPAAMRLALPEAKAAIYLPMSLAITFPFNIIFGIPFYYTLVKIILQH